LLRIPPCERRAKAELASSHPPVDPIDGSERWLRLADRLFPRGRGIITKESRPALFWSTGFESRNCLYTKNTPDKSLTYYSTRRKVHPTLFLLVSASHACNSSNHITTGFYSPSSRSWRNTTTHRQPSHPTTYRSIWTPCLRAVTVQHPCLSAYRTRNAVSALSHRLATDSNSAIQLHHSST
jgi:hypothetical protein